MHQFIVAICKISAKVPFTISVFGKKLNIASKSKAYYNYNMFQILQNDSSGRGNECYLLKTKVEIFYKSGLRFSKRKAMPLNYEYFKTY